MPTGAYKMCHCTNAAPYDTINTNYPSADCTSQYWQRMMSTSEEEEETQNNSK
jgi:hypothetical protein